MRRLRPPARLVQLLPQSSPAFAGAGYCPKCQSLARAEWLEDRQSELLTTPYFHVVFTLPEQIAEIACQNKAVVYGILFRAAAETPAFAGAGSCARSAPRDQPVG